VPKRKKASDRVAIDTAVGIVGWLLVIETMLILERRGVLKAKDGKRIVLAALNSLDMLSESTFPHPSFGIAREILLGEIQGWEGLKHEEQ
jgi:hypothetical protein